MLDTDTKSQVEQIIIAFIYKFMDDTKACVAKLGEAHRLDSQNQLATRGLLLCMKDKGWSGLREK